MAELETKKTTASVNGFPIRLPERPVEVFGSAPESPL